MKTIRTILAILFAAILLLGAWTHITKPEFYDPFVPSFIPASLANIFSIVAEASVGVLLLIPKYRKWGGLGFMVLMLIFLPIHVWDLFRETPAIGSSQAAIIRVVVQLLFIAGGWWIWKKSDKKIE